MLSWLSLVGDELLKCVPRLHVGRRSVVKNDCISPMPPSMLVVARSGYETFIIMIHECLGGAGHPLFMKLVHDHHHQSMEKRTHLGTFQNIAECMEMTMRRYCDPSPSRRVDHAETRSMD
jgi:hypothetical protein